MKSRTLLVIAAVVIVALVIFIYVMGRPSPRQVATSRTYAMTGFVMQVMPGKKKVSIANDDIPAFMQPMVMEYEVADQAALANLKRGDQIHATLRSDGAQQWILEDVTVISPSDSAGNKQ